MRESLLFQTPLIALLEQANNERNWSVALHFCRAASDEFVVAHESAPFNTHMLCDTMVSLVTVQSLVEVETIAID
jgi:hypothetical protein